MASPTIELDKLHKKLIQKYSADARDQKKALEIQSFLNSIKSLSITNNKAQQTEYQELVDRLREKLPNNITQLFTSGYGAFSEINLAWLIEDIEQQVTEQDIQNMATRVGGETMNIKNIDELIKLIPQDVVELYGIRSERYITDAFGNKSKVKAPYAIARKTDNKGTAQVELNKNISPLINKLQKTLAGATFTTKAYSQSYKGIEQLTGVKLGRSNSFRAIGSTLSSLGYSTKNIAKFLIQHAPDQEQEMPSEVRTHLEHLQFVYELTGAGSVVSSTGEEEFARFLIWNEPSGEIRVASTKTLVRNVLEGYIKDIKSQYQGEQWYTISFEDIKKYSGSI